MSKKSILVIAAIAVTVPLAAQGDDVAAVVVNVVLVGAACFVIVLVAWIPVAIVGAILDRRKLAAAVREFQDLQVKHGYSARDHCPHRVFTVGHTDYVVLTASDKWCRVCGKHLGSATLKKSIWGNRWE
jgi:hypothetical protein